MHSAASYRHFVNEAASLGYEVADGLNIVGWRNTAGRVNHFDCRLAVYTKQKNLIEGQSWPITTYPGLPYMLKPLLSTGVATVYPGQYRDAYSLGEYKGYTALKQVKPITVLRDANRNEIRDGYFPDFGMFGIHIHKAGMFSSLVGHWSAGCQVFQKSADFDTFIAICQKHKDALANKFTYTLLEF